MPNLTWVKRLAAVAAVLAVLAATAPSHATVTASTSGLEFLHASHGQVVDEQGRTVILRGINVNGLEDYWTASLKAPYPIDAASYAGTCPKDNLAVAGVPLCERDLDQIAALGMDVIRLPVSWSLLEPRPGHLDPVPVARIAQVVGWARQRGIRVVIDMHQDDWSKYIYAPPGQTCPPGTSPLGGGDGAPAWASKHLSSTCAPAGTGELAPAVQEAAQYFWTDVKAPDGVGLQEHYASVVTELAKRFSNDPAVAGYELMNEPQPGLLPEAMDETELMAFHAKMIKDVIAAVPHFRQLFFIEPGGTRNVTASRTYFLPWSTYSSYPNVVYAPHVYTGVFTADSSVLMGDAGQLQTSNYDYGSAEGDAKALGLPLWVGEFGNDPREDRRLLDPHYTHQDAAKIGGALWIWKENGAWGAYQGPYDDGGTPRVSRVTRISTVYPAAVVGTLDSFTSDPFARTALVSGTSAASKVPTIIEVPFAGRITVKGASYTTSGHQVLLYARGGAWSLRVSP